MRSPEMVLILGVFFNVSILEVIGGSVVAFTVRNSVTVPSSFNGFARSRNGRVDVKGRERRRGRCCAHDLWRWVQLTAGPKSYGFQ